ncbi:hypothetical protein SAMN05443667_11521 [Flavobacterium gillisiae]|uniref:RiboL-PSP-HEPN domain-containing protein n=1 Tax=Flavobacterium gillisiae TaxID=150146 RepID=A0A1H4FUZ3_9FLAO|nr:hypothetical protein [Flavobacterium gillisiae]SEB00961.1 hypothetical protein SAMN05443667_11521 [Flavobacterium gillisiae]
MRVKLACPDFKQAKNKKYNKSIDKLIQLRNDIVHLKPVEKTNSGYKGIYRDLLDFDFQKTILAVKIFMNFYENNLIEECQCGKNLFYDTIENK